MGKINHTPTPWHLTFVGHELEDQRWQIHDNRIAIADVTGKFGNREVNEEQEANAEFIIRAVNAHDALILALQRIVKINGSTGGSDALIREFKAIASDALAQVKP